MSTTGLHSASSSATFVATLVLAGVGEDQVTLVDYTLAEGLSTSPRLTARIRSPRRDLDRASILRRQAALTIETPALRRIVNGIVVGVRGIGEELGFDHYELEIVPAVVARLEPRRNCRVFQDKDASEIVRDVLAAAGLSPGEFVRFDIGHSLPRRTMCVQYNESDLAFVSRLLEDEGLASFFDPDEGLRTMVVVDDESAFPTIDDDAAGRIDAATPAWCAEQLRALGTSRRDGPDRVVLQDYDPERPLVDLRIVAGDPGRSGGEQEAERYEYPGGYTDPQDDGRERARRRLDAETCDRLIIEAHSRNLAAAPGRVFTISDHPRTIFNGAWLIVDVAHNGTAREALDGRRAPGGARPDYDNRITAIPLGPYRPPRRTPRPVVCGVQTATVAGPAGETIHVDDRMRIRVRFHWDLAHEAEDPESCSAWLRVAQTWAGPGYGAVAVPRVGTEVVVTFIDGDPDRPLVVGQVYNGDADPPVDVAREPQRTAIVTQSLDESRPGNALVFDDTGGAESIELRSPHAIDVCGDERVEVVARHATVRGEESITLRVGASTLVISEDAIEISAPTVRVKGQGEIDMNGGLIRLNS